MAHIFISYRSTDRDFVLRLANDLRDAGFDIWLDQWKITGRKPYWREIQDGIEECSHFLFVISPESIGDDSGAMKELYHADQMRPSKVIVPVVARETAYNALPMLISPGMLQIHDFAKFPYNETLTRVIRALQSSAAIPPSETQKQRVAASTEKPTRNGLGNIPGGWVTIGAALVVGVLILGAVLLSMLNSNQQAAQQTQTAVALAQNAPTSTVVIPTISSTDTQTPSTTPTDIPPLATSTLTVTPTATDTIAPTSTNTPPPTLKPSETSNVAAIAANPTATVIPPTATVPTLAPTVAPTVVKTWPCDVTVKQVGASNKYSVLRRSADPNSEVTGTVEVNDRLRLSAKQADSQNGSWYKVIAVAGIAIPAAWIPAQYITLTSQCPS